MTTITMDDSHVVTIEQLRDFLKLNREFQFAIGDKKGRYRWIEETLRKFSYHRLKKKKERTIVRQYIRQVTEISNGQLTRLIKQHKRCGKLIPNYAAVKRNGFRKKYGPIDIALLIKTDAAHDHLSGEATKKILQREYETYRHDPYKTISGVSVSHLYNIRNHNRQYNSSTAKWIKRITATQVNIGIRAKPQPEGRPGFVRVDTVHSGDLNGRKGAYHINIVDEVTQWEMIATVEAISEYFLTPVIAELLRLYPFRIHEFHSDNGSEYINHVVAELLTKLYVRLTKSRARYSNDNALVESKNGSIIRKLYGRNHIPARHAPTIDAFNRTYFNRYLNYHRPCGFAEEYTDARGKIKKRYTEWMTPYEKLRSLPNAAQYLKEGITFAELDAIASAESDNDYAENMNKAKVDLFKKLSNM